MSLQNLRWPVVVAAMAIALAGMFGGSFLLQHRTVEEPLRTFYAGSELVESVSIEQRNERYQIKVGLKDTPDLAIAYTELDEGTKQILRDIPYTLNVVDKRSKALEQAFQRINLYVQEALATGQFATMADRVEQEAAKAGFTAKLNVDNQRVYVQLHNGENYLYSVVERPQARPTAVRTAEGGFGL